DSLKRRVKKLEKKKGSRTHRLFKVGRSAQVVSSEDEEVTLVNEAQGRNGDNLMFDIGFLDEQEVEVEKVVSTAKVTTASATTTTVNELTLAQTLIEIKAAKPKAVTTAATTTTTVVTRPKARGVVVQEPSEFRTTTSSSQTSQLPQAKDKGKEKMVEPEKPLKKKDQILIDEEIAQRLQEELSKMFVELMDKRKKHFARLRAEEQRRKPPTKAQKRSQMSTYLKHMDGYKQYQLKNKNYDEIQKLFNKAMTRVNMFVDMDTVLVKESSKKEEIEQESSSKRA
ncbi:hypothetical protein Tco_1157363, partial [Tanacetum coccineum]